MFRSADQPKISSAEKKKKDWPIQLPDVKPIERAFQLLTTKLKVERPTDK